MGCRNKRAKEQNKALVGSFATAEEDIMACDEAARRFYGPDAYLNLLHQQSNFNPSKQVSEFKMVSLQDLHFDVSLANINAQPSVHLIHQRLKDLKKNGFLNRSSSYSSSSYDSKTDVQNMNDKTHEDMKLTRKTWNFHQNRIPEEHEEKPQIDLNEFLQQLGILRDECQSDGSNKTKSLAAHESSLKDDAELEGFAEESFNLDALIEMHGIEDRQGADASSFQGYGMYEERTFPPSIRNF